ncbi:MAG: helix-turn-helix domain-containing protein, partial [Blautia wexlerae]
SIMVSQKDDGIIATEIEKCINEYEGALFFLESSKNLTSMRKIYSDFCANSAAMSKIFIHRKFRDMYDVIFSQEITNLAINRGNRNDQIKSIIEALKDDSNNLMETLAVYLIDCDSQLSTTAATLFLHRNTVTYRLNKIKQITNTDFTLMPATYDFYLAAALWRLNENS